MKWTASPQHLMDVDNNMPFSQRSFGRKLLALIIAIAFFCGAALAFSIAAPAYAAPNFAGAIPNIPGKSLIANEVNYGPDEVTPAHTHETSAFIYAYVISGAIESKVNDGETRIYHAGESFTEPPGAIHSICRNASKTEPAKMLVVFVVDTNHKAMLTPVK